MSAEWNVAQVNVGRLRAPVDDPLIADFVAGLDQINAVADAAPGFVWRLQTEDGNATAIRPDADDALLAVNMSVWRSVEDLAEYVYRSDHVGFMRRRREWFDRFDGHYLALWWIAADTVPTVDEALERLAHLDRHGPTEQAFTFRHRFDPPSLGGRAATDDDHRRDACPA